MAFASGSESTDGNNVFKRYIGVGSVFVVAVNPDKKALEDLYKITIENDPQYISTVTLGDIGNERDVKQVRLDFILKTDPNKNDNIDFISKASFFVRNEFRYNRDGSKIQIINKYGETTWVNTITPDAKQNTEFIGAPAWFEYADVRPCYVGEEEVTNFIKVYLNIPSKSYKKADGTTVTIENKADAEARLDSISEYFKGNFSELQAIIAMQPSNKLKALFGVKTTAENKQYQDVYIQMFLRNYVKDYSKLDASVKERKDMGSYPNTEFEICSLKEYGLNPTSFDVNNEAESSPEKWGFSPS